MINLYREFDTAVSKLVSGLASSCMDVDELTYLEAMTQALESVSVGLQMRLDELESSRED